MPKGGRGDERWPQLDESLLEFHHDSAGMASRDYEARLQVDEGSVILDCHCPPSIWIKTERGEA